MYDSVTQQAMRHTILPVQPRGDTLVLRPTGDLAGFGRAEMVAELNRVKSLLAGDGSVDPDNPNQVVATVSRGHRQYKNLIVDFGGSGYFGSEMIGYLVDLRKSVPPDGNMALTGLSDDMQAGLKVMHLDGMWSTYDTAEEAVGEIAHEPIGERVHRNRTRLILFALLLLAIALVLLVMFTPLGYYVLGDRSERDYNTVTELYEDWKKLDLKSSSPEQLSFTGDRFRRQVERFAEERRANTFQLTAAQKRLLTAVDRLKMSTITQNRTRAEDAFLKDMQIARYLLKKNQDIEVAALEGAKPLTEDEQRQALGFVDEESRAALAEEEAAEAASDDAAAPLVPVDPDTADTPTPGYAPPVDPNAMTTPVAPAGARIDADDATEPDARRRAAAGAAAGSITPSAATPANPSPTPTMSVPDADASADSAKLDALEQEIERLKERLESERERLAEKDAQKNAERKAAEQEQVRRREAERRLAEQVIAAEAERKRAVAKLAELRAAQEALQDDPMAKTATTEPAALGEKSIETLDEEIERLESEMDAVDEQINAALYITDDATAEVRAKTLQTARNQRAAVFELLKEYRAARKAIKDAQKKIPAAAPAK